QFVPTHKPQQSLIERKTNGSDGDDRGSASKYEASGMDRGGEADIATSEIERAMREIDDAKQTKNQTETARDHEEQGREGRPIKQLEKAHGPSPARNHPIAGSPPHLPDR